MFACINEVACLLFLQSAFLQPLFLIKMMRCTSVLLPMAKLKKINIFFLKIYGSDCIYRITVMEPHQHVVACLCGGHFIWCSLSF